MEEHCENGSIDQRERDSFVKIWDDQTFPVLHTMTLFPKDAPEWKHDQENCGDPKDFLEIFTPDQANQYRRAKIYESGSRVVNSFLKPYNREGNLHKGIRAQVHRAKCSWVELKPTLDLRNSLKLNLEDLCPWLF